MEDTLKQAYDYVMREFRSKDYCFWQDMIAKDAIEIAHPGDPNLIIEVEPMWNSKKKPGCEIRVLISTFELKPTRFRTRVPTASFVIFEDNHIKEFEISSGRDSTLSILLSIFRNPFGRSQRPR